jgi:hypothetical protein
MNVVSILNQQHTNMTMSIECTSPLSHICIVLVKCLQLFVPPVHMQDPIVAVEAQRRVLGDKVCVLYVY